METTTNMCPVDRDGLGIKKGDRVNVFAHADGATFNTGSGVVDSTCWQCRDGRNHPEGSCYLEVTLDNGNKCYPMTDNVRVIVPPRREHAAGDELVRTQLQLRCYMDMLEKATELLANLSSWDANSPRELLMNAYTKLSNTQCVGLDYTKASDQFRVVDHWLAAAKISRDALDKLTEAAND